MRLLWLYTVAAVKDVAKAPVRIWRAMNPEQFEPDSDSHLDDWR